MVRSGCGPGGRAGASDAEAAWERGALRLSALAALAGVPQVHFPLMADDVWV